MVADQRNSILFVVFGIPGAGKTTVAKHVVQKLLTTTADGNDEDATVQRKSYTRSTTLYLDLDDCVPKWMRLNFAKGIYPTLQQRNQFASSCCDYVNESIQTVSESSPTTIGPRRVVVIVSFSFVNEDLRINFRKEFPDSHWILINTSEIEAQRRIQQRSDHFYKGKPHQTAECFEAVPKQSCSDNIEWTFAPVTFPHTIINGHNPIEETSSEIVELVQTILQASSSITYG